MVLKRVAVTGASGMTGRHLLAELAAGGTEVIAVSRSAGPAPAGVTWRSWDLCDWKTPQQFSELFGSVDAVFHVGAAVPSAHRSISDAEMLAANVTACRALGVWAAQEKFPCCSCREELSTPLPRRRSLKADCGHRRQRAGSMA